MVARTYNMRLLVAALHMRSVSALIVAPSLGNSAYRRVPSRFISAALERPTIDEDDPRFRVKPSLTLPEVRYYVFYLASLKYSAS